MMPSDCAAMIATKFADVDMSAFPDAPPIDQPGHYQFWEDFRQKSPEEYRKFERFRTLGSWDGFPIAF